MTRLGQGAGFPRMAELFLAWLALIVVADITMYGSSAGLGVAAFLAVLAGVVAVGGFRRGAGRTLLVPTLWLLAVAGTFAHQPGVSSFVLLGLALPVLALLARRSGSSDVPGWSKRWIEFLVRSWIVLIRDLVAIRKVGRKRATPSTGATYVNKALKAWIVPVLLTLGFLALFSIANPVFEKVETQAMDRFLRGLEDLLKFDGDRVFFWVVIGIWVWALLRPDRRIGAWWTPPTPADLPPPIPGQPVLRPADSIGPGVGLAVRTLILCNVLFALQNALDVRYLWSGGALPAGMSHTEYAHRGAYTLIATAILAGGFVLIAFRPGGVAVRDRWARALVFAWIAQNLLLTVSALWRLWLYVEVNGLYRLRFSAAVWMDLVFLGLLWICLRIAQHRDNRWLLNINAVTLLVVLTGCAWFNENGYIAGFNARRCNEVGRSGVMFDFDYARELGPEALPALRWLRENAKDAGFLACVDVCDDHLRRDLYLRETSWQAWTLRTQMLKKDFAPPVR